MSAKTIKRILYGVFSLALLAVGLNALLTAGANFAGITGTGAGVLFAYMAITGAG